MASNSFPPPGGDQDERLELIRQLVIEAGLEVLDRDGLGLQSESITYARVFAYLAEEFDVHLSRSSVHGRIWSSQDDFRADVLGAAARHSSSYGRSADMHDAIVAMLVGVDALGLDRRGRVMAFSRVAGRSLLARYLESSSFRRLQAIKAAARADDESAAILRPLVVDNVDGNREERIVRFRFMFRALGLRARSDLGLSDDDAVDLFLVISQTMIAGAHLDHHAGFGFMASTVETDLSSSGEQPWTYYGFAFLAWVDALFEEDPDVEVPPPNGYPSAEAEAPLRPTPRPPELGSLVGDRPRRTREELRELVLAAGVQLLLRDGLRLKSESLTYASVFAHIKRTRGIVVHRSTVHQKIWSSQDEFRAEILATAAADGTDEALTATRRAMAAQVVARNPDGSVNLRQMILDNMLATFVAQLSVASSSTTFRRWQSIKATMLSPEAQVEGDDGGLRLAMKRRQEEVLAELSDTFRSVLPLAGLEVNPALHITDEQGYHLFAAMCATLYTGTEYNLAAGATSAGGVVDLPRFDDPERLEPWPIPAVGALAALDLLFVPRPVG